MSAPVTFDLVDHHGTPVTAETYRGRWLVVQFGFTACRMVCPRALAKLDTALDSAIDTALDGHREALVPLYVTVDPDRDSPEVLRTYLGTAHPRFTGLTGTHEQVERAKQAFQIFARRRPDAEDPDGSAVPHTAITHLVGPDGRRVTHWADTVPADRIAADLASRR